MQTSEREVISLMSLPTDILRVCYHERRVITVCIELASDVHVW